MLLSPLLGARNCTRLENLISGTISTTLSFPGLTTTTRSFSRSCFLQRVSSSSSSLTSRMILPSKEILFSRLVEPLSLVVAPAALSPIHSLKRTDCRGYLYLYHQ
ncbi:GSCOCG00003006001-RA-CDS [Cotesia congregata]|nr:GSCOCG00003006001-RA-CDS [Cotesia congregata]